MEVLALVVWAFIAVGFVVVGLKGAYMSLAKM